MHPALVKCVKRALGTITVLSLCACATPDLPVSAGTGLPVNTVQVSDRLVTSGRLSDAQLMALDPVRFRMVINLAPTSAETGNQNEAQLLADRGIAYLAIPVGIARPEYRDFLLFSSALDGVHEGAVWVHCRVNYRASMFAFLYRVIHEQADPEAAYEKVTEVWMPTPSWLRFAREILASHEILFEL